MKKFQILLMAAFAALSISCNKPEPEDKPGQKEDDTYKETVLEGFKLNGIVSDGMVIQRGKPFRIWGTASRKVKVFAVPSWDPDNIYVGVADKYGLWYIDLPEVQYVENDSNTYSVKIYNQTLTTGIKDLIVGDVWVLTGQSNMGISVAETVDKDVATELAKTHKGKIRYCCPIPVSGADKAQLDYTGIAYAWASAGVQSMSAVGYFFAQKIYEKTGVPIGLLNVCMGGTCIQCWFPGSLYENDAKIHEDWSIYEGAGDNSRVSSWYNSRVNPAYNISSCGFLWYQGEGNANEYAKYPYAQVKLMESYRELFRGDENTPFYYVQLAPYEDGDFVELRYAQGTIRDMTTATGMAVILDRGEAKNIHPTRKMDAGQRSAFIALNQYYGMSDVKYLGPQYDGFTVSGNTVKIRFKNAEGLKTSDGEAPKYFEISLDEGASYFEAAAEINGEEVWITRPDISEANASSIELRYAWVRCPETNLYNGAGLPAEQFRTEEPSSTEGLKYMVNKACSSNMVIQRGKPFHIFGHAFAKGVKVYAKASWDPDHIYSASSVDGPTPDDYFPWAITLPEAPFTLGDNRTHTVTVYNKYATNTLTNLVVGDVWVLSGQSNMGISVHETDEYEAEKAKADNYGGMIRYSGATPAGGSDTPKVFISDGNWSVVGTSNIANIPAIGYYFAEKVYSELQVPIGLVNVCMGGTAIQTWFPRTLLDSDSKLKSDWGAYDNNGNTGYKNCSWYNSRVHPVKDLSVTGFLWYQGEGNINEYDKYPYAQKKLMDCYRELFGCTADAPFYYFQLAPYGDSNPEFRNAQKTIREMDSATGMVTLLDRGDKTNIHPTRKLDAGLRAAAIALSEYYHRPGVIFRGPAYKSHSLSGNDLRIEFDYAAGLTTSDSGAPKYFEVSLDGGTTFNEYVAMIDNDGIDIIDNAFLGVDPSNIVVRYAWKAYLETNLYNGDGFPAEQFITSEK